MSRILEFPPSEAQAKFYNLAKYGAIFNNLAKYGAPSVAKLSEHKRRRTKRASSEV